MTVATPNITKSINVMLFIYYFDIDKTERIQIDLSHPILQQPPSLLDLINFVVPPLRNKWRDIGIQLGISPGDLDAIYDRRNRDSNQCYPDVFSAWEKSNIRPYKWCVILEAISSDYVNERKVAEEIRQKVIDKYGSS